MPDRSQQNGHELRHRRYYQPLLRSLNGLDLKTISNYGRHEMNRFSEFRGNFGCVEHSPIRPYERNLFNADNARLVIWPVVSSERITSRNGARKTFGSIKRRSSTLTNWVFNSENCFIRPSCSSSCESKMQIFVFISNDSVWNLSMHWMKNSTDDKDTIIISSPDNLSYSIECHVW